MNRGVPLAPQTGTPAQWEAEASARRKQFAQSFNRGIKTDRDGNIIGGGVQKNAVPLPPTRPEFAHPARSGRGINALMHRGDAATPSTAAPVGRGFVRHVYDAARRAGIPETQARLAAAQAAHESAYGKRAPGHNYFGVKGVGTAGSQMLRTHEQGRRGMYKTTSKFARYAKPEDSLRHWWDKIQRQWPEAAGAQTFEEAARGLRAGQRGGYATDRKYVEKIRRIAAGIGPSIGVAGGSTPSGPTPPTSTASKP